MKNRTEKRVEILAPAGTYEALEAAVRASCDAVYLGGDLFSARAFAGNFAREELLKAIDFCHFFDVKVYLTVNTLFKNEELLRLTDYLTPFYEAGLDAVIVQDLGAASVMAKAFPQMELHASTQLSISSAYGAKLFKDLGFTRIVPARELSVEEIRSIKNSVDIEIESFVHGAMCFAYSGKCLFSSFLGARSGNRGRCAQPCRQCYEANIDGSKQSEYMLSLKDMCTLLILPELVDAGIDSFKIEGRMKNPHYVAAVTNAYKTERDRYLKMREQLGLWENWNDKQKREFLKTTEKKILALKDIYNRGGFCTGYYKQEKGPEMFAADRPNHAGLLLGHVIDKKGPELLIRLVEDANPMDVVEIREANVELTSSTQGKAGSVISLKGKELKKIRPGMHVYRTRNNLLLDKVGTDFLQKERTIPVKAYVDAVKDCPLMIRMEDKDCCICAVGQMVEAAAKQPTTKEQLKEKLKKTKGSGIDLEIEITIDPDIFISMSEFNALRREAIDLFKEAKKERYYRK